ncbi:MAG: NifU family protein [Acidimicrobiia bacterium]
MPIDDRKVISVTPEAIEAIVGIRAEEPDAGDLALSVAISGVRGLQFAYELTFIPTADAADDDVIQTFGELPVVLRADSVPRLEGATIEIGESGLGIDNPNNPSPSIPIGGAVMTGPMAERVAQVLAEQINPAIAAHGGRAELVGVEGTTVYLKLGGGCQGCGMARVTLGQGIEVAIRGAVPEVGEIIDITDHASGENPYYEAAKK